MKGEDLLDANKFFERARRWRMRGEQMRALADEAHDAAVRAMMLAIAADYDRLAECADDGSFPAIDVAWSPAESVVDDASPRN
jgi:hypothetical protein